jgi:hypothetical protein
LDGNKKHRVTKHREERSEEKDNWFDMIAEQRNADNGHGKTPVQELPNTLRIKSEVERTALKVRPAGV